MFYKSEKNTVCADVIPFYENGKYYLFYLKDYRDIMGVGEGCDWHLVITEDLVHYQEMGPVIKRGNQEEQDLYVYTGCCVKYNEEYYIFYTGHNPHYSEKNLPVQKILLAKSSDLLHWHKMKDFSLEAPKDFEKDDFRDPFVYYDENKNMFGMLIAGRKKCTAPTLFKGCILVAYSKDLLHWEISNVPFYAPNAYFTHECPDLFQMGNKWYLIFSEFTDRFSTHYRMSDSIDGPWIAPKEDTFDGHAFYAAKSIKSKDSRILFGWNPIKDEQKDDALWQWGGTIIPHEILQEKDGTLVVKCPDPVQKQYHFNTDFEPTYSLGVVSRQQNSFTLGSSLERSLILFEELKEFCKIEFDFEITDQTGDFGVILNEMNHMEQYYILRFEPLHNRLSLDKWPRKERTQHTLTDVERYCSLVPGKKYHVIIIKERTLAEIYVNERIAMSIRMFDFKGKWGFYSMSTKIFFKNVRLYLKRVEEK